MENFLNIQDALFYIDKYIGKTLVATELGSSVCYPDRQANDIDVFTIIQLPNDDYFKEPKVTHYRCLINNVVHDFHLMDIPTFMFMLRYGSLIAYQPFFQGNAIKENYTLRNLVSAYFNPVALGKLNAEMLEGEFYYRSDEDLQYLQDIHSRQVGHFLQYLAASAHLLYGNFPPTKLVDAYDHEVIRSLKPFVEDFTTDIHSRFSETEIQILKDIRIKLYGLSDSVRESLLTRDHIITSLTTKIVRNEVEL